MKQPNPVSIRVYKKKAYGEFEHWLKLKYAPGCRMNSMDLPEQRAYELYKLLEEHFNVDIVKEEVNG